MTRQAVAARTETKPDVSLTRGLHVVAVVAGMLVGLAAGLIVRETVIQHHHADFGPHVSLAAHGIRTGTFPGNVGFYWLDALLAGFSPERAPLMRGLFVILTLAVAAKVWLSVLFVGAQFRRVPVWGGIAAAFCALAFSLPAPEWWYIGQIPANVWHNSTTMLLMPFAIGLFWASLSYLRTASTRLLWVIVVLSALNVLVKPSFLLCFLVVFPIAALMRFGRSRETFRAWSATAAGAVFLALQYVYIYVVESGDPAAQSGKGSSSVVLDPFSVWSAFSSDIPRSLLASYLFPAVALLLGGAAVRRSPAVRYALGLAFVGLLWFALLKETGYREMHANFMWQAVVTNYLLFLTLVGAVVASVRETGFRWRHAVVFLAFAVHVVAGVVYLHHWLTTGNYL